MRVTQLWQLNLISLAATQHRFERLSLVQTPAPRSSDVDAAAPEEKTCNLAADKPKPLVLKVKDKFYSAYRNQIHGHVGLISSPSFSESSTD